ncbi:MAG: peptidase S10 [Acidobacteria bacterium]|nr:peptidase S10 [Acidobacteriota bacterium]
MVRRFPVFCLLVWPLIGLQAQQPLAPAGAKPAATSSVTPPTASKPEPDPVSTRHTLNAGGKTLNYTVTTGRLPIVNEQTDAVEAHMFFVAYTLNTDQPRTKRPLLISFNGGPGSASVWMHMGMIGPKRVRMTDDGAYPPPPFVLEDNPHTFLPYADLVFIDPVGTGYSRAVTAELGRKFFGVQGDIASVGEFIRLYLTRYDRWASPLYMIGESYGTFRAAGIAGYLVDRGVAFNGVMLISTILNYQTVRFNKGNDLPNHLFLPTYTAIAWYHKKLAPELQKADLRKALKESEEYAQNEYPVVLAKGDRLTDAERKAAIDKLHRLTGLDRTFIDQNDLRIEIQHFTKELRRADGHTVGRLDGRLDGVEGLNGAETPQFDPSMTAIRAPYTALFVDYVRTALNYKSDLQYYILGGGIGPWDYGAGGQNQYVDTSDALRQAFAKNPYMKLYVGFGYYDLATPYFAAEYTLSHMGLPKIYQNSITRSYFESGHMFYIHKPSLERVSREIGEFISKSLPK